ncbi:MAG: Na+/H+ antiporter subunit E [Vicinamibacterales bacterium]
MSRAVVRVGFFALLWWMLTAGDRSSWIIGAPVVCGAAALSLAWSRRSGWQLTAAGLAAFIPYFLWRSMAGSLDVAWRTLHPRMPIAPAIERYPLRLPPDGPARVFFADVVSLLPGTLSADLDDTSVTIHVLSGSAAQRRSELRRLEDKVGGLFGRTLTGGQEPSLTS